MQNRINDYQHCKKINGYLKSSLRKSDSDIAYDNMIRSKYMFKEYLNLKQNEQKKYKPKIFTIQIILNLMLLVITYYSVSINLTFLIILTISVLFFNWFIIRVYSLIFAIRSKF